MCFLMMKSPGCKRLPQRLQIFFQMSITIQSAGILNTNALGHCPCWQGSKDYIEFLKVLDSKYPKGDKIRLVLDNLKVHTSEVTRKYLSTVPGRFEFVFTPKHGSWLNMIESFFSKMTKRMLRGIRVKTKEELKERIYKYFDEVNEEPVIFHWKYNLDDIDVSEEVIFDFAENCVFD